MNIQQLLEEVKKLHDTEQLAFMQKIPSLFQLFETEILQNELKLLGYMFPEIKAVKFKNYSQYDDDGGYDRRLEGLIVYNEQGEEFKSQHSKYLDVWSSVFFNSLSILHSEWSGRFSLPKDENYIHPFQQLLSDYTPKNPENWKKLWRLCSSLDSEVRNKGISSLEAILTKDKELQRCFADLAYPSLEENYIKKLPLNVWFLMYSSDEAIQQVLNYRREDLYAQEFPLEENSCWWESVSEMTRSIHKIFLPLILQSRQILDEDISEIIKYVRHHEIFFIEEDP